MGATGFDVAKIPDAAGTGARGPGLLTLVTYRRQRQRHRFRSAPRGLTDWVPGASKQNARENAEEPGANWNASKHWT